MPVMVRKQSRVDGVNYQVCGLCGSLNRMGQIYKPIYMVYEEGCGPVPFGTLTNEKGESQDGDDLNKLQLCFQCYFDQWMEVQPEYPFPDTVPDGRVQASLGSHADPNIIAQLQKLEALADPSAGGTEPERNAAQNAIRILSMKYNIPVEDYSKKMVPGKGLVVVSGDDYEKWAHALEVARASGGAETVQHVYHRLYESSDQAVDVAVGGLYG